MNENSGKKVIINSIIYSFSGILLKCFAFFLLPLYTAYLTTEDYGVISIAQSFITTVCFIVAFSLFSAILRFYVDLKNDERQLKRFYGTVVTFVTLSGIIFGVVLTIFRDLVSKYIFAGTDYYPVILICLIYLIFFCQQMVFDNILKSQQKALKSSIVSIAYFFLNVLFNIIFVVGFKMGAAGSLLATMIVYLIIDIYFIFDLFIHKSIIICLDFKLLKSALAYSVPIMPHNLSTGIALLISKVIIGGTDSLASVGVYSVATQFGNIADTVQSYVDQAYGPWLYEQLHNKVGEYKKLLRKTVSLLISVIGLLFIGLSLFAQDYIFLLINSQYHGAWKFIPFIVLVYAIKTSYYFYVEILFFNKSASKSLFIASVTGSLINVLLSYLLIPSYGVNGSIFADAVAMVIRVAIVVIISKKYEDVGLRLFDFVKNFAFVFLFIAIGLLPSYLFSIDSFSILNFAYKVFVMLVSVLIVFLLNKNEIILYLGVFKKRFLSKKVK